MRSSWIILVIAAVLAFGGMYAVLTRYEYHSARVIGAATIRVDRWTGRVQSWKCWEEDAAGKRYEFGYAPRQESNPFLRRVGDVVWEPVRTGCGWLQAR